MLTLGAHDMALCIFKNARSEYKIDKQTFNVTTQLFQRNQPFVATTAKYYDILPLVVSKITCISYLL